MLVAGQSLFVPSPGATASSPPHPIGGTPLGAECQDVTKRHIWPHTCGLPIFHPLAPYVGQECTPVNAPSEHVPRSPYAGTRGRRGQSQVASTWPWDTLWKTQGARAPGLALPPYPMLLPRGAAQTLAPGCYENEPPPVKEAKYLLGWQ